MKAPLPKINRRLLYVLGLALVPVFFQAEARQVRVATYNVLNGVGTVDSPEYLAVRDTLQRIDADIIAFQELRTIDRPNWEAMAAELGYDYTSFGINAPLAGGLYVGYFSRYPILESFHVLSPPGANDITRPPHRVVVDIPDAASPLVLWNLHQKASSGANNDFRRAVEAYRCIENIDEYLDANPTHLEYVVLGDMNADIRQFQTAFFSSIPSGLPASYSLGTDITFPVYYATFPLDAYEVAGDGMVMLDARQTGSSNPETFISSNYWLDYIFVSRTLYDSPLGAPEAEVYNSILDDGVSGLPKSGSSLPFSTSTTASDHYLVFADIHMTDAWPEFDITSLRNGGFEIQGSTTDSASSWELGYPDLFGNASGSVDRVNWRSRSGDWHAAIMGTWRGLGDSGEYWQDHDAIPGLQYRFSAWFWADEGNFGGVWSASEQVMRLQFYSEGQEVLSVTGALTGVREVWQKRSVSAIAPPSADRLRVSVYVAGAGTGGALQLDDLEITGYAVDVDGNGLPDYWEMSYFTNYLAVVGSDDSDGDGYSNWEEYVAGTNPLDDEDFFSGALGLTPALTAGNVDVLLIETKTNRIYDLYWTDRLEDGAEWLPLGRDEPGTGGDLWLPVGPQGDHEFYRAAVKLP